ncbi:MAG: FHA domain-containing protein [Acidobacteriaceae bacterium]|nr:FHA domain-containing protein [Acidobacteriaceae bacterium]MBV9782169.1 FHA domain-containing protein [Acidobacteriaceae bacterium]
MRSLDRLDSWITSKIKGLSSKVSGAPRGRELLEIRRDILEDIRDHIEPKGGGRSVFAYNTVAVTIAANDSAELNAYEAAFAQENGIEQDIRELLIEAGCPIPPGFSVRVSVTEDVLLASVNRPFRIEYSNEKAAQMSKRARAAQATLRPNARLRVLRGEAEPSVYVIDSDRVNIGRMKEVIGDREGLRRRNDLVFADSETTVSREHADIRFDADSGKFRLYDSHSQRGTAVFRNGRRFEVPRSSMHGFQLSFGDEIHLGDARVIFESD